MSPTAPSRPLYPSGVPALDPIQLLRAYDTQLRGRAPARLPEGVFVERDGPLLRFLGFSHRGFIDYRELGTLDGSELDELIARQVAVFAARGEPFEWKLYAHDRPPDLAAHLTAAGLQPESEETVVVAAVAEIAAEPLLPEGVSLREVDERRDFERIAAMEEAIDGDDHSWLAASLEAERALDPDALDVFVAEAGETVVCAGWLRCEPASDFASFWGGGTLPQWRGRGIYRARVGRRAQAAGAAGPPLPAGGRLRREPSDPRAARLRRAHDDDAVRLVARRRSAAGGPGGRTRRGRSSARRRLDSPPCSTTPRAAAGSTSDSRAKASPPSSSLPPPTSSTSPASSATSRASASPPTRTAG